MKKNIFTLFLLFVFLLSGCMGPSPEENIYNILEEVVSLEDPFKDQQEPLLELEKKETELYNKIMNLGMKEFDQVVTLSKEAIMVVEERETKIQSEYESIISSKEKFADINEEIAEIEDEKLSQTALELKTTMESRYQSYEKLYKDYKNSLSLDKELYEMLQKEDLKMEDLEAQISEINDSYEVVLKENEQFNKLTEKYNTLKMQFYEEADINVEISE